MASFLLSRVLGLLRIAIQARVLGGTTVDAAAFTTAISVPDFVFTIVSGGALGSSFIPVFAGMLELGDEERAWRVASGVMNAVLIVMAAAVVIAELAAPGILAALHAQGGDEALQLTRIMLLQPLFLALSGILMGLHNSYHRFVAPAVAPLVYNLANIGGLLLVPIIGHGVAPAAWGVTIGALLQVLVMAPGFVAFRHLVGPGVGLAERGTREVGRLMVPRVIGQAGIQFSGLVTVALANNAYFFADHPVATIRYAGNLFALPVGIFGGAIATAAFPTLVGQAARGDRAALGRSVSQTLRTMLFFATPAAVALVVLRYPIVDVLYSGQRFHAHDTDLVASALLLYAAFIPVWVAVELLPRAFFALKDTWTPVLINLVTLATAIVLSIVAANVSRGNSILGVALLTGAISVGVVIEALWLTLVLRRRVSNLGLRELGMSFLRSLVAAMAMGVALLALLFLWHHYGPDGPAGGTLDEVLLLCIAIPLGAVVYAGWSYLLDAPELAAAWAMVRARLRK